ncbi:rod shape-determining protein MreD [Telmatospirillum siberiense]|uniref:Rod shape-determining protein MreD n=1 Tax=Telmatospirillum siberiense TaxID=382514 RepID=A0A2N3PW42_9PROT|nr:rod shape-determining protein MreD [Telmatospirillum siberiense]PKU24626.1 rod shape-determining protein MreD [Telmatospirillum siberiense]
MKGTLLQRIDQWFRHLLPVGSVLLLILINALPTRLPGFAAVVPLLPLIGIYYWSIYRPDLMPPALAFGLGLLNDVIAGLPLGVSSLIYLLAQGMTASQRRFFHGKPFRIAWWGFGLVSACALALQWLLVSLLLGHTLEPRAVMFEFLMTLFFYPLLSWFFARIQLALLRSV